MTRITADRLLDLSAFDIFFGAVTVSSSSLIRIEAGSRVAEYRGNFTYDQFGRVFGQLETFEQFFGSSRELRLSELNLDAFEVFSLVQSENTNGLLNLGLSRNDVFEGSGFNDVFFGLSGDDALLGMDGDDRLRGDNGADTIDGGSGNDVSIYNGNQNQFSVTISSDSVTVRDRVDNRNGSDSLTNIESLEFFDGSWQLSQFNSVANLSEEAFETFAEMYIAYFNRAPDSEGLLFWANALSNGTSIEEIATLFFTQEETRDLYPDPEDTEGFVNSVYQNVLGRTIDQGGFDFWVGVLNDGSVSRPEFMLEIIRGAKAPAEDGSSQEFIDQKAQDIQYLENKADLGIYFSAVLGMSNVENAQATLQLFDGSEQSLQTARSAIDSAYSDAQATTGGEFLLTLGGVVDDPFMVYSG